MGVSRVPGQCAAVASASIHGELKKGCPVVFTPGKTFLEEMGLQMEDSLLAPDQEGYVSLMIHNPTNAVVKLESGLSLGEVEEFEKVLEESCPREEAVNVVRVSEQLSEARKSHLKGLVNICSGLSDYHISLIQACLEQAADVFAIEKEELGEVSDVYHHIETGGSPPVRQAPRHTPFSLRPEITRQVNEMLAMGVI